MNFNAMIDTPGATPTTPDPFSDAAICAIDGFGDYISTSMAVGRNNQLDVLAKVSYPHSLGVFYTAVTQYLGFPNYGDEFKVIDAIAQKVGATKIFADWASTITYYANCFGLA